MSVAEGGGLHNSTEAGQHNIAVVSLGSTEQLITGQLSSAQLAKMQCSPARLRVLSSLLSEHKTGQGSTVQCVTAVQHRAA